MPYKQRVGGSNPSTPTDFKPRYIRGFRLCTPSILFTLRELINITLDFLPTFKRDFANTIEIPKVFHPLADLG